MDGWGIGKDGGQLHGKRSEVGVSQGAASSGKRPGDFQKQEGLICTNRQLPSHLLYIYVSTLLNSDSLGNFAKTTILCEQNLVWKHLGKVSMSPRWV